MEVEVTALAFGGRGVARLDQVWLVAGALPGERVQVEEERRRRGVVEGRVVRVLHPSPWREAEPCPQAGTTCGGCDFAHVAYRFREQAYKASLAGALRGAPESLRRAVEQGSFFPSPWHYRLRGRLHWDPQQGQLGFFAPRSHRVANLQGCRVLSQELVALLPHWANVLRAADFPAGEVEFLEDLAARQRLVLFRGMGPGAPPGLPGVQGFWNLHGGGWGERELFLALPEPLVVPLGSFVQGNRFLLEPLCCTVAEVVRDGGFDRVVDLYGGVGFLAAAAWQGGARQVRVVEVSRRAAAAAQKNLPRAQVWATQAEAAVQQGVLEEAQLLILDPPRGGLSPLVRRAAERAKVQAVLYLSCDPACLARDSQGLVRRGFQVVWAKLFDLFAGTHHVELAVLFQRA
ncbi:MAG: TRAM domain-containing protein [Thermoanaerobaculum sp.]|nr:TRAM domain-containing protein [Thermoanaerobaculum sp.]